MKVVVAPDSFKGSLAAAEVAAALARGIRHVWPEAETVLVPVADGGEGTLDALLHRGGEKRWAPAHDPLGRVLTAPFGLLPDGKTAVVELAAASGLTLVAPEERRAGEASTFGTGELLRAALDAGAERILLGLGGSATTDGGSGLLAALGARFLDRRGQPLPPGGHALSRLASVDLSGLDPRLARTEIRILVDVDHPLLGPRGAARVFGPQKGAGPEEVQVLEEGLSRLADLLEEATGRRVRDLPGGGAAGGTAAGLVAALGATLCSGIEAVLDTLDFDDRARDAHLVVTGEGRMDAQTRGGKAPLGVARRARSLGVPAVAVVGSVGEGAEEALAPWFSAVLPIADGPCDLASCMQRAPVLLEATGARLARLLSLGRTLWR